MGGEKPTRMFPRVGRATAAWTGAQVSDTRAESGNGNGDRGDWSAGTGRSVVA